ncbi:MAG: hypothetical protein ACTSQO_12985 [Candidatus Helarchaeota archaeon]
MISYKIRHNVFIHRLINDQQNSFILSIKESEKNMKVTSISNGRSVYRGYEGIVQFWRDLLGDDFAFKDAYELKTLKLNEELIFEDVILTEWLPRIPGLFFHEFLWKKSEESKLNEEYKLLKQFNYADIRLGHISEGTKTTYRIFSIVQNAKFAAHGDISKGIPIIIPRDFFISANEGDKFSIIENTLESRGAIKIKKLKCKFNSKTNFNIKYFDKLGEHHVARLIGGILNVQRMEDIEIYEDLPKCPILGNAWTYFLSKNKPIFVYYHFWVGVDEYKDSINRACKIIMDRIPNNKFALFEIDAIESRFSEKSLESETKKPSEIYLKDGIQVKVFNKKNIIIFTIGICLICLMTALVIINNENFLIYSIILGIIGIVETIIGGFLNFKKDEFVKIDFIS